MLPNGRAPSFSRYPGILHPLNLQSGFAKIDSCGAEDAPVDSPIAGDGPRVLTGLEDEARSEVSPVARFVREHASLEDRIWFALDYSAPDCCVRHGDDRLREIEVTVAQGSERFNVMTELNQTGIGRGFLGLSDDAPMENFVRKMDQPREAYTEDEIGRMIIRAVAICARNKSKFRGDTLLIEAPLQTLPTDRWGKFTAALSEEVKELAFPEVYVTGRGSDGDICLRI